MDYIDQICNKLKDIEKEEAANFSQAAKIVKHCLAQQGLIYVFGSGHSHLMALETFYRAGGLANVVPMLDEGLMLHRDATYSSVLENTEGYEQQLLSHYQLRNQDVVIVVSNSNNNPVPIGVAIAARQNGAKVITISSKAYWDLPAKHSTKQGLHCYGDVNFDNHQPYGDCLVSDNHLTFNFLAGSSVAVTCIMNTIFELAIKKALQEHIPLDIYMSENTKEGKVHNATLISKYKSIISFL